MNGSAGNGFNTIGYCCLGRLISEKLRLFLSSYAMEWGCANFSRGDTWVPDTPYAYADSLTESLLEALTPRIESASGLTLFPTYSYLRIYKHGDVLRRHQDRPACEVSVSVSVAHDGEMPWPLWIQSGGEAMPITLGPGEALLYKGTELFHWRNAFNGRRAVQVFLHYVDQTGQYKEWRYDKRSYLGSRPEMTKILTGLMG